MREKRRKRRRRKFSGYLVEAVASRLRETVDLIAELVRRRLKSALHSFNILHTDNNIKRMR